MTPSAQNFTELWLDCCNDDRSNPDCLRPRDWLVVTRLNIDETNPKANEASHITQHVIYDA
jgi:hypothetical protein